MRSSPVGAITRGTTNPNRLRRCDRWLAGPHAWRLRQASAPIVVDLGYGASPVTAVELRERLRRVRADVEVVGIEIDPVRVAAAQAVTLFGAESPAGDAAEFTFTDKGVLIVAAPGAPMDPHGQATATPLLVKVQRSTLIRVGHSGRQRGRR